MKGPPAQPSYIHRTRGSTDQKTKAHTAPHSDRKRQASPLLERQIVQRHKRLRGITKQHKRKPDSTEGAFPMSEITPLPLTSGVHDKNAARQRIHHGCECFAHGSAVVRWVRPGREETNTILITTQSTAEPPIKPTMLRIRLVTIPAPHTLVTSRRNRAIAKPRLTKDVAPRSSYTRKTSPC